MARYRTLIRRQQSPLLAAGLAVLLAIIVGGARWTTGPVLATASGSPYQVVPVVDTNPDPDIVETTIVAAGSAQDVGNGVIASVLTFNGTLPGPQFRLKAGDTVIVHFQNNLGHASGIHWHGIELANASDGTPLSQNMVPPGGSFLYKFVVPRPGIYWYHPHHHSSTNQVFKGLYGSIIVADPNEAALQTSGTLPPQSETMTMVLSDLTVCKAVGNNDTATFDPALPHASGGPLPLQLGPTPFTQCEGSPLDEDSQPRGPYAAGDVPNIQTIGSIVNEGQTVVTNGMNVGGRAGTPAAPGPLASSALTHPVKAGQGLRLQLVNSATVRFFRLHLSDALGNQIPIVRVGGQGGLLDHAHVEGGVVGGFNFKYASGELLIDPGDRADVVVAIPAGAAVGDVLTLWTLDFQRAGTGYTNIPTVPVAHFQVTGSAGSAFTIANGTPLRAATGNAVEVLGAPTASLLNPATFVPSAKPGMANPDLQLTIISGVFGINNVKGAHDPGEPYQTTAHPGSARYAKLGDTLELTVTNATTGHHPFHLHGFSIQPIRLTRSGNPTYTFPYAEFLDNIDVPAQYTLTYRVRLDDRPLMDGSATGGGLGRWVLHCHIFSHATSGMIGEFDVVSSSGNERPYINEDETLVEGYTSDTFTVHGTYHDPDGDPVLLSASSGVITDDGSGQWTWTRTGGSSGLVYVSATDSGGRSDQVAFALDISVAAPQAATTLAAAVNGATVTFTWSAPAAGATPLFYTLEGGTAPGLSTLPVMSTPTNATAFTTTLPAGTYYFRLRSGNGVGMSAISNEVVVQIGSSVRLPGAPIGLAIRVAGASVSADWRPATVGGAVVTWQLEVGTTPGGAQAGSYAIAAALPTARGNLAAGEYFIRVRGVNEAGAGPASNEVRFRVGAATTACASPESPVLLPATVAGPIVTLSWRPPSNTPVDNYRLAVGSAPGASNIAILDVGPVTSFAAEAQSGIYHVKVQATNACGASTPSANLQVAVSNTPVPPPAPAHVRARVEARQVWVDWDAVPGASSYVVEAGATPGATAVTLPVFAPTLTVTGVPPGTYYVRVRAVGLAGAGVPSINVVVIVS